MSGFIYFTNEQMEHANHINLVEFLSQRGEPLERSGHEWRLANHHEITINGCAWYHQYERRGGLAIDFVKEFYSLSFPEAVSMLLDGSIAAILASQPRQLQKERKPFALPEANGDMRRVYAHVR